MFVALTVLTILGGLLTLDKKMLKKKYYIFLMCIAFVFVSGLRSYKVGTDTPGYVEAFLDAPKLTGRFIIQCFQNYEALYYILQSLVRTITDSYTVFFLIIATFYISCVGFFVYKYSEMPAISFLLFMSMGYFSFSMAGLRQTIAMGFLLLALRQILNERYVSSFVLIFVASFFHIVSWVFLLIYLLKVFPLNKVFICAILILCGIFYLYGDVIWQVFAKGIWGDSRTYESEYGGISTLVLLVFVSIATLIFYPNIFGKNKGNLQNKNNPEDVLFFKMLLLSVAFQVLAVWQANAFRLSMIFHVSMIPLLPKVLTFQKKMESRYLAVAVVIVALCIQLFLITANASDILPFTFFWQV